MRGIGTWVVATGAAVLAAAPAWAQPVTQGWAGHPYYMMGGGHMFGGGLFSLLVMVALVALVVVIVRRGAHIRMAHGGGSASRALDILQERFARGEVSVEEYQERKKHLTD